MGVPRIGFLAPFWIPGGAERWHETFWRHFLHPDFAFGGLAVENADGVWKPWLDRLGPDRPRHVGPGAGEWLRERCDLVIAWGPVNLAPLQGGPPVLYVCHHDPDDERFREAARARASGAARLAAVHPVTARTLSRDLGRDVSHIGNVVEPPGAAFDRRAVRKAWGVPPEAVVAGYLGTLSLHPKRLDRLILSVEHLPEPWRLVLAGYLPSRGAIESLLSWLRPEDRNRILVIPPVEDPFPVLAGLDLLVHPAAHEGFGLAIGEAWAAGVPVVATPVGVALDHPDLVRLLPRRPEPRIIAEACRRDWERAGERKVRAERARRFALGALAPGGAKALWRRLLGEMLQGADGSAGRAARPQIEAEVVPGAP